ncbi:hypothetical protein N7448_002836 [Penicillium atrosanguineum]|nr:hypothetical protein N7448_002836 [Penicillium atrosanguineum]
MNNDSENESLPQDIELRGQHIATIEDALQFLRGCEKSEAYLLATQLLEHLLGRHEKVERAIDLLYNYVEKEELWRGQEDHADFRRRWQEGQRIQARRIQNDEYLTSNRQKAINAWGEEQANAFFGYLSTRSMVELASKFITTGLSYEHVRLSINNEVISRLSSPGRGVRNTKGIIQGDLTKALHRKCLQPLVRETLIECGLQLDQDGYCCATGRGSDALTAEPHMSIVETETEDEVNASAGDADAFGDAQGTVIYLEENDEGGDAADLMSICGVSDMSSELSEAQSFPDDFLSGNDEESDSSQGKKRQDAECGCSVKRATMNRILAPPADATNRQKLVALRSLGRLALCDLESIFTKNVICMSHAKRVFELFNMRSASKNHTALAKRVDFIYRHIDDWDTLVKTHLAWFRPKNGLSCDPPLDLYRFRHQPAPPLVADYNKMTWLSFESLYRRILPTPEPTAPLATELFQQMTERGSVVIPQLFGWLKEDFDGNHPGGLLALAHEEMDMYNYHYLPRTGKPRLGWLRNMWHGIIQQLVRQDPAYYACYVFFRPDHAHRLISFPYYAKSTMPGEQTRFRHIDVNLNDLFQTGRGHAILQGSLSLDDEDEQNCTELLYGMHRHIHEWWASVRDRMETTDGYVQKIDGKNWTKEDAAKYGADWAKEVCMAGDVRISLPTLPHGSTGPATKRRRCILPWFVRVRDDHSTLDTPESGTWEEVSAAHRDLIQATRTPSGFTSSKYGHLQYAFPAAPRFHGEGLISDCLVGRARWTDPGVSTELDVLFGQHEAAAAAYIASWRRHAQQTYADLFLEMIKAEKQAFGKDSFFRRKESGLPIGPPQPEVTQLEADDSGDS